MKKKLLSLLLALCLVMALVPMTAFAEGTSVDNWDGSADTSWYTSAPDASEYHISTAEQLAGLAQLVNTDPGTTNFAGKLSIWKMTLIYPDMNGFRLVLSSAGITLNTVFVVYLTDRVM